MNPTDLTDIDTVVAAMNPAERAEFDAWCDERDAEALAYQMAHEDEMEGEWLARHP